MRKDLWMNVQDIKNLPNEFDFKSRVNPFGITYHAKLEDHHYVVTWGVNGNNHKYTYSKEEFRRFLFHEEFVPCVTMEKGENSIELE